MQMFAALSERIPIVVNNIGRYVAFGPVAYIRHAYREKINELDAINKFMVEQIGNFFLILDFSS